MDDQPIARTILTLRTVLLAIAGGIVAFGAVAVVLVSTDAVRAQTQLGSALLPALAAAAVAAMVVFAVVRQASRATLRRADLAAVPPAKTLARFQGLTIIGGALAELPSLFGIVVFLLTRQWVALLAPVLGLAALSLLFPSRDKYARFAEAVTDSRNI
jgi:hypothetical protein